MRRLGNVFREVENACSSGRAITQLENAQKRAISCCRRLQRSCTGSKETVHFLHEAAHVSRADYTGFVRIYKTGRFRPGLRDETRAGMEDAIRTSGNARHLPSMPSERRTS
jgi:hypothetical protein